MKKIISLLLALVMLVAVFAGCGAKNEGGETTTEGVVLPASALEILENVWALFGEEETFAIVGGDGEAVVANADKAIGSVEKSLDGIDKMVKNVDKVVVDNTDSVSKTVERMSSIDITALNKSIKDLSDIIEPLAKFFRR